MRHILSVAPEGALTIARKTGVKPANRVKSPVGGKSAPPLWRGP